MPDFKVGAELERLATAQESIAQSQQMRARAAKKQADILEEIWTLLRPVLETETSLRR